MYSTLHAAANAIRKRQTTPLQLVEQCLAAVDRWERRVRAWVFIDREGAIAEAKRLGQELEKGTYRGPLHGIPIGIKDIFDVFDWPTAAGSKLWARSVARQDAVVVERLRRAGAIFLGKTVTTCFASFDPPVTRNPWNFERTPGGSSSGSAAALACGMCLGALGSQTGGSITRPASYCGVAGLKPSHGVVPCDGVVPLAPSMDHPGPMARCVHDLAILFQAIAGWPKLGECAVYDDQGNLRLPVSKTALGRAYGLFTDHADGAVRSMMDATARKLGGKGVMLSDMNLPTSFAEVLPRHRIVMAVEGAAFHEARLRKHPEDYGPKISGLLEEGLSCPAPEYARCKEHQAKLKEEMSACFSSVDALLTPATTGTAPDASTTGDPAFNSPWSYTGLPTVSFPVCLSQDGLPLAIQLVGARYQEDHLLAVAAWCEKAIGLEPLAPPDPENENPG
jgi:aspartyl-tRNA(Asn)/glutamyl-tRNA(Gln) amidotransferase subunit A